MSARPLYIFLSERRDQLIERFVSQLGRSSLPPGDLPRSELRDSLPKFFDEMTRELSVATGESLPNHHLPAAIEHGVDRWQQGFDLRSVVREYGILRHVILADLDEQGVTPTLRELNALSHCLSIGVAEAVSAYADESDDVRRTLSTTERELESSELRLRTITESVPQIIWTATADGSVDWFNRRWLEYSGLSLAESVGVGWLSAVHEEDRARVGEHWSRACREGTPYEFEYRIRRHDQGSRWFLGRATRVESRGAPLWFGSCTDIHDQKQIEAQLRRATEESERLNRLKDDFLATVSHELRTPLQSMLGWTQLLTSGALPPERARGALETVERNARAQSQLIEDILDVSRMVSGKARVRSEAVDLAAVLQDALDTSQLAAKAKGVALVADIPELGSIVGDADRIQQVIWNLLSNAVKFTPRGGSVRLSAERQPSSVRITVKDDGQGIPASFLPHVFERFRQADAGPARAHGGLGLGLAIARSLVELHGGVIVARSEGQGRGAEFTVTLPTSGWSELPRFTQASRNLRSEPSLVLPDALAQVRALVVDDQPDARELLATVLTQFGASVTQAANASEALSALRSAPYDLLVSDIGLPEQDGYALLERVRALPDPNLASLPAIAVTAYAAKEDAERARRAGYQLHLAKPIEPARLVSAAARYARRR